MSDFDRSLAEEDCAANAATRSATVSTNAAHPNSGRKPAERSTRLPFGARSFSAIMKRWQRTGGTSARSILSCRFCEPTETFPFGDRKPGMQVLEKLGREKILRACRNKVSRKRPLLRGEKAGTLWIMPPAFYRFSEIKLQKAPCPRAVNPGSLARNLCNYLSENL